MKFRITIVCENSVVVPFGVIGEHGFAAFVETPEGNFLFDTGQGKGIIPNCTTLGRDLRSIRFLYISHGHYDHTLGIPQVLTQKSPLDIYIHPGVFQNRFWIKENTPPKFIGIPYKKEYLESLGAKFKFIKGFTEIERGLFASGEIPRKTEFEKTDENMKVLTPENTFVQDEIPDDFSLAIDTPEGLVVLLGCAHAGMVNILNHFIEKTGKDTIYAVIGGTHLGFATSEQFEKTLDVLDQYKIARLGVSHCTGLAISARLCAVLKERFFFASVGAVLEI